MIGIGTGSRDMISIGTGSRDMISIGTDKYWDRLKSYDRYWRAIIHIIFFFLLHENMLWVLIRSASYTH